LTATNSQAYSGAELITAAKSFMKHALWQLHAKEIKRQK
jgi:hypothetical protein